MIKDSIADGKDSYQPITGEKMDGSGANGDGLKVVRELDRQTNKDL